LTLMKAAKPDGVPESLGGTGFSNFMGAMAQDEAAVYIGGGEIARVPKDGSERTVIASPPDFEVSHLLADERHVYFSNWQKTTLERIPKEGGSPEVFVGCTLNLQPKQFVVDDGFVYWIAGGEADFGALKRAPK
jgi:hypothetical protein